MMQVNMKPKQMGMPVNMMTTRAPNIRAMASNHSKGSPFLQRGLLPGIGHAPRTDMPGSTSPRCLIDWMNIIRNESGMTISIGHLGGLRMEASMKWFW